MTTAATSSRSPSWVASTIDTRGQPEQTWTSLRMAAVAMTTVKRHVNSILSKLGVHSRLQAVARARELGNI